MRFQTTPLPGQPKMEAEVSLTAENPHLFLSSAKASEILGISVTLNAAGKNSNVEFFFFYCCPL